MEINKLGEFGLIDHLTKDIDRPQQGLQGQRIARINRHAYGRRSLRPYIR